MPKIVDHDAVRAALVERAGRLFVEKGYSRVGMREVAAAAEVPKSTLYHYFATKEALLAEVSRTWMAAEVDTIRELAARHDSLPARLQAIMDWVVESEAELLAGTMVLLEACGRMGSPEVAAAHEQYIAAVARVLGIAREQARVLLAVTVGAVLHRQIDGGRLDLRALGRWLVASLAPSDATPPASTRRRR